jgi:glutamyl-tRNA synthetase
VDVILTGLRWLGLFWDEGPLTGQATGPCKGDRGPYFQSQRLGNYQRHVEALLSRGLAYEQDGAIKFRMDRTPVVIEDLVAGEVTRGLTDREQGDPDFVIMRSDGKPVFHLTNVVDDLEMGITHVIRGEDHLSNTARHIALFRAFGVHPPKYAHIPLILNRDGSKMSKRDQGASLTAYVEAGYAPEAVVNYLCLLGWSPKGNREIMPIEEIIELFDLPQIHRHNARFDHDKLLWMNGEYCRAMAPDRFYELSVQALARAGLDTSRYPSSYVRAALDTCKGKFKLFSELPAYGGFYFRDEISLDAEIIRQEFTLEVKACLQRLRETYAALTPWQASRLEAGLKDLASESGIKVGALVHPVRLACTGARAGPSLYHLMEVLGRERVLARLDKILAQLG